VSAVGGACIIRRGASLSPGFPTQRIAAQFSPEDLWHFDYAFYFVHFKDR
jgi:hypothetical protein